MDGVVLIAIVIIGFIVTLVATKKVGQMVYNKTGYNGFSKINMFLSMLILLVPVAIAFTQGNKPVLLPLIIGALVPVAILVVLNLKAKNPVYIIVLTLLQIMYGLSFILFYLLKFTIKVAFKMTLSSFDLSVPTTTITEVDKAYLEKAEYFAKENGFASADEYAKSKGYNSAVQALKQGAFAGKL